MSILEQNGEDRLVDAKSTMDHWDDAWSVAPRMRLPSRLNVGVANLQRVLARHVRPGSSFLEIGCAPGKMLAWVGAKLGAKVSGLDYSVPGIRNAHKLFETLSIPVDLRCENVFETTFAPGTFDYVYSAGVIEHFDDPREIVARHVSLLKPGGLAIITVPNYGGLYGAIQRSIDPADLAIHNLGIMTPSALRELAPKTGVANAKAYSAGRFSPWIISWSRFLPGPVAKIAAISGNALGLLQPFDIDLLAPMLVLEIRASSR